MHRSKWEDDGVSDQGVAASRQGSGRGGCAVHHDTLTEPELIHNTHHLVLHNSHSDAFLHPASHQNFHNADLLYLIFICRLVLRAKL